MASLALMVAIIFLITIVSGPLAITFSFFNFQILSVIFGILAILFGGYFCCVAPFPVSIFGGISLVLGILAIKNL